MGFCCVCSSCIISFLVLFGIGIPLLVVGYQKDQYYVSNSLISIPLFPTDENRFEHYIGVCPNDNEPDKVIFDDSDLGDFSLDIQAHFSNKFSDNKFFIVHNLWGYDIDLTIGNQGKTIGTFKSKYNMPDQDQIPWSSKSYMKFNNSNGDHLKSRFIAGDLALITCPCRSLIADQGLVYPECKIQAYAPVDQKLHMLYIGKFDLSGLSSFQLNFSRLQVYPSTFMDTPQMLIFMEHETNAFALQTSGLVFTVIGVITFIVFIPFIIMSF